MILYSCKPACYRIFFIILILSFTTCSSSIVVNNKPADKQAHESIPVDVYAGGHIGNSAGYWKNGDWIALCSDKPSGVNRLFISNNNIYAFGAYSVYNKLKQEYSSVWGYWKNGKWFEPKPIDKRYKAYALGLYVSGDDVYISGINEKGSGIEIPGYWKNAEWKNFPSGKKIYTDGMSVITVSNNDVYVGWGYAHGYFKNDMMIELPVFNGALSESRVTSIAVHNIDVYAGGYCVNNLHKLIAGYWKNGVWIPLMSQDSTNSSKVNSIFIYNDDVYAGGHCVNTQTAQFAAGYWKNGVWVELSDGKNNAEVTSIVVVPRRENPEN